MEIICYFSASQLSFKNMRNFIIIGILCALAPAAFAQAADPNAIDLSGKMDTIAKWTNDYDILGNLNVGLQNPDQWEDFEIFIAPDAGGYNIGRMRFGGPLIFDSINNPAVYELPTSCADFDGDGIKDLIVDNGWFHKGRNTFPYYDSLSNITLRYHDFDPTLIGAIDYDGDGFTDLLLLGNDLVHSYILFYKGGKDFGTKPVNYATDSIAIPPSNYYTTLAKFVPNRLPMIVLAWGKKILLIRNDADFTHDTVELISDTSANGITITNIYSMDITGDGIADLLVSDGFNIYIFKGGDDFGTYQLTREHAFYRIKSPRLLDFGNYGFLQKFGEDIHACGDLTGSGIPYVCIGAEINEASLYKGYEFFYAGGKALDSLFDASLGYVNQGPLFEDTLHRINSLGRTAGLVINGNANGGFDNDLLLFKDCDKIPHTTNPQMGTEALTPNEGFEAISYPAIANRFVKVFITSPTTEKSVIEIFDLLGRKMDRHEVMLDRGNNTEYYDTSLFAEGTYIVRIDSEGKKCSSKFIIRR